MYAKVVSCCLYLRLIKDLQGGAFYILAFPTGRYSAFFWDKGTELPSLSQDKGTMGQAKNLAKGRDGSGQPKSRTGRAGTAKNLDSGQDTGQNGTEQKRTF